MSVAGMFLGVNTLVYQNLKNKGFDFNTGTVVFGGFLGGLLGSCFPPVIPVYAASIPCYFVMTYLDKNELI